MTGFITTIFYKRKRKRSEEGTKEGEIYRRNL